ncbi:MAG TPA: hypothetical protein DDW36_04625, partial [Candidatus Magasanikbacteria bacterium]|nr:hypothetical protein [Candidatus Magasanikbacteria bacterium]
HTPWSAADKFVKCPFAKKKVEGMLQFDLIAFHAQVFEKNFRATVDALGFRTEEARIKTVPAALDPKYFHALRPQPPAKFDSLPADGMRIVAVERIEPVKGADKCLAAFKVLLTRRSDLMGHLQLVLVGYDDEDSRLQVSAYREYFRKIKGLIDEINERFGQPGYLPVKTVGHLSQQELMGIYHHPTTRVVIVSSTADGMNFIHQEAALMGDAPPWYMPLLSEHAGAAAMIGGHGKARLFNPLLLDDHVNAMLAGLEVPREEAHACMRAIRANMEEYTSRHWADGLIEVTCRNAQELRGYAHSDVDQDES